MTDTKQFIGEIACPGCARTGHATWQRETGTRPTLLDIGGGFDKREDDVNPGLLTIVCSHCGTTQPPQAR